MISLAGGLPDAERFPTELLAELTQRVISERGHQALQYGITRGDESTRAALCALFGQTPVDPEDLVVTTGSQQALDLLARALLDPGDAVVVSDPEYLGALQVFRGAGAVVRSVGLDDHGLNTSQLEDELRWGLRPKLCYVVPHFHNPTGATMNLERRVHLDQLADRYGFVVVEDDPYRELYFDANAPTDPPQSPDHTVRLRSTSKTLAPGLRVGVLAGPPWLTAAVVTAKQSVDLHTSTLCQAIVCEALHAPWIDDHLRALRELYRTKRDALAAALRYAFDDNITFALPHGGMFLWADLAPAGIDDSAEWLRRCLDELVCFVPGSAFAVQRSLASFARFSFATGGIEDFAVAAERLARVADDSPRARS